jgi:hypothetical protein
MAKAAAPYVHARLASTEVEGDGGGPLVVEILRFTHPDGLITADPHAKSIDGDYKRLPGPDAWP